MRPIGGYFELEAPPEGLKPLHPDGVRVNSGRNALEYILRSIGTANIGTIYVPLYTCEVVIEPLDALGVNHEFYRVNRALEMAEDVVLGDNDYIIVNNYFGLKDDYVDAMARRYPGKVIADNSQALYAPHRPDRQSFYSPRKFVGLPDGGIAYAFNAVDLTERDESNDRCSHLLKRLEQGPGAGFDDFHVNSAKLHNMPLRSMSAVTATMMGYIDFEQVADKRRRNYDHLRSVLEHHNLIDTPDSTAVACPMVYPYLVDDPALRKALIGEQIFVANYWPNIKKWAPEGTDERFLAENLLPLPIDQRYTPSDMDRIIETINRYL